MSADPSDHRLRFNPRVIVCQSAVAQSEVTRISDFLVFGLVALPVLALAGWLLTELWRFKHSVYAQDAVVPPLSLWLALLTAVAMLGAAAYTLTFDCKEMLALATETEPTETEPTDQAND